MTLIHGSHWGAFEAVVDEGRLVEARPFDLDPTPSPILKAIPEAVHHPGARRAAEAFAKAGSSTATATAATTASSKSDGTKPSTSSRRNCSA